MKQLIALGAVVAGLMLAGCANNSQPSGEHYPAPAAHHHSMGGKLGN